MMPRRRSFGRSVLALAGGGLAAQAVVFLARPVLTRMYSPEAWGEVGVFLALASGLSLLATLRYEDAILLPESDAAARPVLALTWGAALVVCGLAGLAVLPREAIATALGVPGLAPWVPWIPLVALLYAYGNGAQAWMSREHAFTLVALAIATQSLATVGVQLGAAGHPAGALLDDGGGLVLGVTAGAIGFALVLAIPVLQRGALRDLSPTSVASAARRYARFPRLGLPATVLGQIGSRLPPLVLGAAFGAEVVGQFGLAAMAVLVPLAFVADAVGQVYGVHAAEAARAGTLRSLTATTLRRLLGFVLYPITAVALVGPTLFALVFGEVWGTAGVYARALAPWLLLAVLVPPLTRAFDATERQDRELRASVWSAGGVLLGLGLGAWAGSPSAAVFALGLAGAMGRLGQAAHALGVAGVGLSESVRLARGPASRTLVCIAPAAALAAMGRHELALGAAVAGGLVNAAWAYRAEGGLRGSSGT
ncbi:MAG TPA: polysaccharide biosynthesis protein [Bacteroidetes bacterium]|nr:polysaccharide biosynthesis protein [Bacteroidota bacterium]HIL57282.1 polysaccharide biosynthesis protein [Rhodothermales bacterium]